MFEVSLGHLKFFLGMDYPGYDSKFIFFNKEQNTTS